MKSLAVSWLSRDEARSLTDEVKQDAERLWRKLVELYDGAAHKALGYASWGAYFEAEFGGSDATAYRLLQSGRVMHQLPIGSPRPATESVARELTPLIFETMVFRAADGEVTSYMDLYCDRYSTEEEAQAGHERVVAELKAGTLEMYGEDA